MLFTTLLAYLTKLEIEVIENEFFKKKISFYIFLPWIFDQVCSIIHELGYVIQTIRCFPCR